MGFLRHFTPELLSIKKSATFAHSTFRIIIPSVGFIPSLVAPQQSQCPFIPTNKSTENFYDTVRFTLPFIVTYPCFIVTYPLAYHRIMECETAGKTFPGRIKTPYF